MCICFTPAEKVGLEPTFPKYKLVSNLNLVSKITEKVVAEQLVAHCEANCPRLKLQSSYRALHSTETALAKVQSDKLLNMDKQHVALLVVLDLSVAFDTVDH